MQVKQVGSGASQRQIWEKLAEATATGLPEKIGYRSTRQLEGTGAGYGNDPATGTALA